MFILPHKLSTYKDLCCQYIANVLLLVGTLYLGKNTHILLNGALIHMDQSFGLFWHNLPLVNSR